MPVETRHFRSDTHTVNSLTARKLLTSQSTNPVNVNLTNGYSVGIRVWKRTSNGVETEVTSGSPMAVADYLADGFHVATWDCPQTALASTDAVVVRFYMMALSWILKATFITEQLGAAQLDSETWVVHYYLRQTEDPESGVITLLFYLGSSAYNSRVEGFSWASGTPGVTPQPMGDGLSWIQRGS